MTSPELSFSAGNTDDNWENVWGDGCMSDRPFLFGVTGMLHRLGVLDIRLVARVSCLDTCGSCLFILLILNF